MGVNVVAFGGKTLLDLRDATATASNILQGATAYGANGNLIHGTASNCGRKDLNLTLPASGWDNQGLQTVAAPGVTADNVVIVTAGRWGVGCIGKSPGQLTFRAAVKQPVAVDVNVIILDL